MKIEKRNRLKKTRAQSIIEYSILLGALAAVFIGMQVYLRRGIQAGIRISADQLGNQEDGLRDVDPREGSVDTLLSTTTTPEINVSRKAVTRGGRHTQDSREIKYTKEDSFSERKDDGWYYVPADEGWRLRREK